MVKSFSPNERGVSTNLIGPNSTIDSLPIRTFKDDTVVLQTNEKMKKLAEASNTYFQGDASHVEESIIESGSLSRSSYYEVRSGAGHVGDRVIPALQKKMINPKIVTGKISELAITPTLPEDLPDNITRKLRLSRASLTAVNRHIDMENFYSIDAKLRLGSKAASIACGLLVFPVVTQDPTSALRARLEFKAYAINMTRNEQDDYKAWQATIAESIAREAHSMNRPYSGGLANPR